MENQITLNQIDEAKLYRKDVERLRKIIDTSNVDLQKAKGMANRMIKLITDEDKMIRRASAAMYLTGGANHPISKIFLFGVAKMFPKNDFNHLLRNQKLQDL